MQKIGAKVNHFSAWPKHQHQNLIGSLNKVTNFEDFHKWANEKGTEFCLSPKYDGSTVVATYKEGKLISLATRGDGTIGENITPNAQLIQNVPSQINSKFSGEVRGEAILSNSAFEQFFEPLGYKNPRNAANGKLRDTSKDLLLEHIEVKWFDFLPSAPANLVALITTESQKWEFLRTLGFNSDYPAVVSGLGKMWEEYEHYLNGKRGELDYEIDGLVVKVNDLDLQVSLGVTSNRPKGAIAIKFPPVQKTTLVEDIVWQRGLTGRINPVGILKPVDLGGVTVSKVSLCGIDEINRLDVAIGDEVLVSRRNDVIPKIEKVVKRENTNQMCTNLKCFKRFVGENLTKCPECKTSVKTLARVKTQPPRFCKICRDELIKDGAYLICVNLSCQGEIYGSLMTWVKELDLKGFGPAVIRNLISHGVTDIDKLYQAPESTFALASNSEKTGKKLKSIIDSAKEIRLSKFLSGLKISSLGTTNGQRLEKHFKTLDAVLNASISDFEQVEGIKTNAKKIFEGLQTRRDLIDKLMDVLTIFNLDESGPLAGKTICVTGDLSVARSKFHDWVKNLGGEIKTSVSKKLDYLVTNTPDSGTSKNQKADKYGIPKMTEDHLYQLLGSSPE